MKKAISALIVLIVFVVAFVISSKAPTIADGSAVIMHDDFILSFLGVLAGFAIAIITFLFANLEQIRKSIFEQSALTIQSKSKIQTSIERIYLELKQDTLCIVVSLPVCLLLIILREWPQLVVWIGNVSKQQIISSIELALLLLTFIALIDIVISLFNLAKVSSQDYASKSKK